MGYMLYLGLPPSLAIPLGIWLAQMQTLKMMIAVRYLQAIERQRHLALSPGEQYRRHLKAGGYRP
jgi:hypothetical protein